MSMRQWPLDECRWKVVVYCGRRDRRFALCDANLIEAAHQVARCIKTIDGRLLMSVHEQARGRVDARLQSLGDLGLRCRSKRRIDHIEAMNFAVLDFQHNHAVAIQRDCPNGHMRDRHRGILQGKSGLL